MLGAASRLMNDSLPPSAPAATAWYRSPALWLTLATILCLAPFANKAVHIDDYLFLRSAKQILAHPADPFGTTVNWYGFEMPLADVTQNPPGACYYLAAAGGLLGWSEPALHLAFLVPAIAAVLGTFVLARRFCTQPALAALVVLISPVFWLSATTLMSDVPMLALWLWAVEFWLRGLEHRSHRWLALSAALVALAALTKYFAAALIPLLLAYTVVREKRFSLRSCWLLVPLFALAAYELLTRARYGTGSLTGARQYAAEFSDLGGRGWRSVVALAFAGGSLLPVACFAPRAWSWRLSLAGTVAAAGTATLLYYFAIQPQAASRYLSPLGNLLLSAQMGLFITLGAAFLLLALTDLWRQRSADSLLLALWLIGTLVFTAAINWTVNGRSILPLAPAVAILLVRRLPATAEAARRWKLFLPLIPATAIAAFVVHADARTAATSRLAAQILGERLGHRSETLWFQGHWGFQYYMEAVGARPLDRLAPQARPGDFVVVPSDNPAIWNLPVAAIRLVGNVDFEFSPGLSTMQAAAGSGFYSSIIGPLPFAFGPAYRQRVVVLTIREPNRWTW